MRVAELLMAIVMALFSAYLMWKSMELPVGWIPGEGPGGGAFPFWLSGGMLLCCIAIVIRWAQRKSPPSQSTEVFMDNETFRLFVFVTAGLLGFVGLTQVVGMYVGLPLFMIYYMRFLGRHSWKFVTTLSTVTPVVTFMFFEIVLKITLPKGVTEEWFYPLYDIFM